MLLPLRPKRGRWISQTITNQRGSVLKTLLLPPPWDKGELDFFDNIDIPRFVSLMVMGIASPFLGVMGRYLIWPYTWYVLEGGLVHIHSSLPHHSDFNHTIRCPYLAFPLKRPFFLGFWFPVLDSQFSGFDSVQFLFFTNFSVILAPWLHLRFTIYDIRLTTRASRYTITITITISLLSFPPYGSLRCIVFSSLQFTMQIHTS